MNDEPISTTERTAEAGVDTRAALLEAGAALVREQPVGAILSQITGRVVAARAGRTTGAFFHHWPTQDAFHRDLVAFVLDPVRIPSTAEAVEAVKGGAEAGVPPVAVLHAAAQANFESVRADPYVPLWLALWAKHAGDPVITELLRANYEAVTNQVTPVMDALVKDVGRVMRAPFTAEMLAVAATALVQGLALRVAVDPDAVPLVMDSPPPLSSDLGADPDRPWDLFSALLVLLLDCLSEPQAESPG